MQSNDRTAMYRINDCFENENDLEPVMTENNKICLPASFDLLSITTSFYSIFECLGKECLLIFMYVPLY